MFYLLENNRIIDSNTLFTKNIPLWEVKDNLLFAKSKNGKLIKPYKYNAIKNQSENVFDLIDWNNDLIRLTFKDGHRLIVYCDISKCEFNDGYYDVEWISAIYKLNEKGNYIKVWERKEEKWKNN